MRERALQIPKSVEKEGWEVLQVLDDRFPCNTWRRPMSPGAGGCAVNEVVACGEPTQDQDPGGTSSSWREVHTGTGFLAGLVTL